MTASHTVAVLTLTTPEAAAIAELVHQLAATSPVRQPGRFLRTAKALAEAHPALHRVRTAMGEQPPAVVLRGLRAGHTCPTPTESDFDLDEVRVPVATLGLVASVVGLHRGYQRESSGRLVHSVAPQWANRDLQISSSSSVALEMHTELAYATHAPDFVLLLCARRGGSPAATLVAALQDIISQLSSQVRRTLHEARFITSVDVEVRGRAEERVGPVPVLRTDLLGNQTIRCDYGEVESTDRESSEALAALGAAVTRCVRHVVLEQGDILVVDNKRALHGRVPFTARFDGTDRWLLRSYVWATADRFVSTSRSTVVPATLLTGGPTAQIR